MKKLLVLLLLVALGAVVYRRVYAGARQRQHGTPDQWPPIVRKPGSDEASAA